MACAGRRTRMAGILLAVACAGGAAAHAGDPVRLHEIQLIGTHNSYHVAPDQAVFERMRETGYAESAEWPAERLAPALAFTHAPIPEQLSRGVRVLELDVHDDPDGGRFSSPGFLKALPPEVLASLPPVDPERELDRPGFKVFHAADTDVRSTCLRFARCLEEIRAWSDAHPGHIPIIVQIETKAGRKPPLADAYEPAEASAFDDASWTRLHDEILAVFPRERLFLPAELQGAFVSVNAAVRREGWPPVAELRGRVIFMLLDDPEPQAAYARFTSGAVEPILFRSISADDPGTGWLIRPQPDGSGFRPLLAAGFLVYTRADANSVEPRLGDRSRASLAMDSGAQLISTDYPWPAPGAESYEVSFRGGFVRCNPVTRPKGCAASPG
ncbi:Ca2+-dependent phosphoinositide-specific phospholipase C [Brevundimonas sp.]|uniref:Ca2+-dependent phosphoinositide-specific phospholipase C n=1 Tax=Brevundimonas sp. TaxID=1871086 RepID=UPI0034592B5A